MTLWGKDSGRSMNISFAVGGIGKLVAPAIAMLFIMKTVDVERQSYNSLSNNVTNSIENSHTKMIYTGSVYKVYVIIGCITVIGTVIFTIILAVLKPPDATIDVNIEQVAESHTPLTQSKSKWTVIIYCIVFFIFFFLIDIIIEGLGNFIYTIAVEGPTHFGREEAALLNFVILTVGLLSKFLAMVLLTCVSIQNVIIIFIILSTISGIIMSLYGLSSHISLWITTCAFKFTSAPLYAYGFAYANEYVNITGFIAGIFEVGLSLGFIASASMTAFVLDNYGSSAVLWEVTVAAVCQALIVIAVRISAIIQSVGKDSHQNEKHPLYRPTDTED